MSLKAEELARTAVWRDRYFAETDKEVRKRILKAAGDEFGIRPAAVYKRWSDNGMLSLSPGIRTKAIARLRGGRA
jgi:hypothetical protein